MKPYPGFLCPKLPSFITLKAHFSRIHLQERRQLLKRKQRLEDEEQVRNDEMKANKRLCWKERRNADVNCLLPVLRFDDFCSTSSHKTLDINIISVNRKKKYGLRREKNLRTEVFT
jgi:hypothetical protein